MFESIEVFGISPTSRSTGFPSLNTSSVGNPLTEYSFADLRFSSVLSFTTFIFPASSFTASLVIDTWHNRHLEKHTGP